MQPATITFLSNTVYRTTTFTSLINLVRVGLRYHDVRAPITQCRNGIDFRRSTILVRFIDVVLVGMNATTILRVPDVDVSFKDCLHIGAEGSSAARSTVWPFSFWFFFPVKFQVQSHEDHTTLSSFTSRHHCILVCLVFVFLYVQKLYY
ncbi:uncharacterized protein LOC143147861 [Ptiloglossa arizonensis]|uniref:uncharacterized protein LOC143147861 n=1 Tax=Ptiloglossa arizonensis TaxID=3350558 RepID=UPI003F9FBC68